MREGGVRISAELFGGYVARHHARLAVEAVRRQRPLRLHSGGGRGLRGGKGVVPIGPIATGIVAAAAAAAAAAVSAAAATTTVPAAAATTSATATTATTTTTAAVAAAASVTAAAAAAARAGRHAKLFRRVTEVAALPKSA